MKAENLMAQAAPSSKNASASLRSAVKTQTAAQSAKADKNDFGSALDSAKNSQKDARADVKEMGKQETADLRSVGKSVGHGRGRKAKPRGCAGRPLTLYNGEIPTTQSSSVSGKRR